MAYQLALGIIGLRLMPDELRAHADLLPMVGEAGGWLFAINAHRQADTTRQLLGWLEAYPQGRVAAPHFLESTGLAGACEDASAVRTLLRHPRFHGIFSRHGGAGAGATYPHANLRAWVDDVMPLLGDTRLAWGSELPVLYWRDETLARARDWLGSLVSLTAAQRRAFLHDNAQAWFFAAPPPPRGDPTLPAWWAMPGGGGAIPLFNGQPWRVAGDQVDPWMEAYLRALPGRPALTFGEFLAAAVDRGLDRDGQNRPE